MAYSENTLWCDGCGVEIFWSPYLTDGQEYCCQECALGIRCQCGERQEWEEDQRTNPNSIPLSE